ncbi:toll-like receptor 2 [Ischnura elegans]|uniref:toll-like receptor 2 n=1 Tax=Ischnura elegans TaxID=197161 RepID=UPI001ED88778|nr:toll-like receptor 2 [Ischnura elegans]
MYRSSTQCFALVYFFTSLLVSSLSLETSENAQNSTTDWKCQAMLNNFTYSKVSGNECNLFYDRGDPYAVCKIYLRIEAPLDGNEPDDSENKLDFGVCMDYRIDFILHRGTSATDGDDNELRCVLAKSVSFRRVDGKDGRHRASIVLASTIFSVIFNAENINEGADLVEPAITGIAVIPRKCPLGPKKGHPPCPIKFRESPRLKLPGTSEEVFTGSVDFNINAFGYSHLSGIYGYTGVEDLSYLRTFKDKTKVGKNLLKELPGENITSLLLSKNKWKTLSDTDLPRFPKLQYLDLSRNAFDVFDSEVLNATKLLKELHFAESSLIQIPSFISEQRDLELLNLGGNKLVYNHNATEEHLSHFTKNLTNIKKLNISGYHLEYFSNLTVPNLPELKDLDISKCEIINMEEDSFRYQPALERIDISTNKLISLPKQIFASLKFLRYVDLSNNKFSEGPGLQFYCHENWPTDGMQALYFSSNPLGSTKDLIAPKTQIRFIDLHDCFLRDVKGVSFQYVEKVDLSSNYIPAISYEERKILSQVKTVNLTENQFNCDSCDLREFQQWLNSTGRNITEGVQSLMCAAPPPLRRDKVKVIEARYNEDLCRGPNLPVVLGSTFSGIALIAALLAGVLYIYRFETSYVLHLIRVRRRAVKGEGKPHSECIYDAFVSYSGRDRSWVLRVLQPELEESDQKYQLCLHDRNFTLGGIITQNIVDSIDKSRKTILILSENFVDSQWCRWEMEMANHKLFNDSRSFLVLIELERLDRKNLPRHLRFLMDTRTYLEWPTETQALRTSKDIEGLDFGQHDAKGTGVAAEPALQVFWKRLREALGDSLHVREQKARKEAEIAVRQSRLRDADATFTTHETFQTEL